MTQILALDLSTHTGFALFSDQQLKKFGLIEVSVEDFNVNERPEKAAKYPYNLIDAANQMAKLVEDIYLRFKPDYVVIENTVRGRNRNTQRLLEFIHKSVLEMLRSHGALICYMDPSEWRSILEVRLSQEDKKNNRLVSSGQKRGRITKKHLSVRAVNSWYGLSFKLKDNDTADAICLGRAFLTGLT